MIVQTSEACIEPNEIRVSPEKSLSGEFLQTLTQHCSNIDRSLLIIYQHGHIGSEPLPCRASVKSRSKKSNLPCLTSPQNLTACKIAAASSGRMTIRMNFPDPTMFRKSFTALAHSSMVSPSDWMAISFLGVLRVVSHKPFLHLVGFHFSCGEEAWSLQEIELKHY